MCSWVTNLILVKYKGIINFLLDKIVPINIINSYNNNKQE